MPRITAGSMTKEFSTIAKNGMGASGRPLTTLAGVQMLMSGGNAVDAAIATAAVLGVVEASSIGIGSDAFCLFYSAKEKKIRALDASGRSPYAASLDFCRKSAFKEMPQRGIHSVTAALQHENDLPRKIRVRALRHPLPLHGRMTLDRWRIAHYLCVRHGRPITGRSSRRRWE